MSQCTPSTTIIIIINFKNGSQMMKNAVRKNEVKGIEC
jgi:hypothetical protein